MKFFEVSHYGPGPAVHVVEAENLNAFLQRHLPDVMEVRVIPWPEYYTRPVLHSLFYVSLVDCMGDDLAPLRNARLSTGNATGVDEAKDDALRDRLWRDKHTCYDDQTEVLVEGLGFIPWSAVTPDMLLGVWDQEAASLRYEVPTRLIREDYAGQMYRVTQGGVDLLVTPSHNMWVRVQEHKRLGHRDYAHVWGEPRLVQAQELGHKAMVRYSKLAPYVAAPSSEKYSAARLRLFGFFVGDGSARDSRVNGISFHMKKQRKVDFLREICAEEGLTLAELAGNNYVVREENIAADFQKFYTADGEKCIPPEFFTLNQEDAKSFLEGLRASDGSTKRSTWQYSTSVEAVAHAVQLLALHAGESTTIFQSGSGMWGVMILAHMKNPVINQGRKNTSWESYSGEVFCAQVSTGVLVVRRNNKIVLSGNSPWEANVASFELVVPMAVLRQIDRHRTVDVSQCIIEEYDDFRKYTSRNEFSARYSEMPDLYYNPPAERFKAKGTMNKQGSASALPADVQQHCQEIIENHTAIARAAYEKLLELGAASELARFVLPQNQVTKIRLQATLSNWFKFLALRLAPDVQEETRLYAEAIAGGLQRLWPKCFEAFIEHTRDAVQLSASERRAVAYMVGQGPYDGEFHKQLGDKAYERLMGKLGLNG